MSPALRGAILAAMGLALAAMTAWGQPSPATAIGITLGYHASYFPLVGPEPIDNGYRMSPSAGAFAEIMLDSNFSLQPELRLVMKGARAIRELAGQDTATGMTVEWSTQWRTSIYYIELPLLANLSIPDAYQPRLKFCIGPYAAVNIKAAQGATMEYYYPGIDLARDTSFTTPGSDFARFDAGLTAGVMIPMGRLGLGGRFSLGFPEVVRYRAGDIFRFFNQRNMTISVLLEYRFR